MLYFNYIVFHARNPPQERKTIELKYNTSINQEQILVKKLARKFDNILELLQISCEVL